MRREKWWEIHFIQIPSLYYTHLPLSLYHYKDIIVNLYKLHFLSFPFSLQSNKKVFHPFTFPPFKPNTHERKPNLFYSPIFPSSNYFSILPLFHSYNQTDLRVCLVGVKIGRMENEEEKNMRENDSVCIWLEGGENNFFSRPTFCEEWVLSPNQEENEGKLGLRWESTYFPLTLVSFSSSSWPDNFSTKRYVREI